MLAKRGEVRHVLTLQFEGGYLVTDGFFGLGRRRLDCLPHFLQDIPHFFGKGADVSVDVHIRLCVLHGFATAFLSTFSATRRVLIPSHAIVMTQTQ